MERGACLADSFKNSSGVVVDSTGKLDGVSVNGEANNTLDQLTEGIPHNKGGVTTVGDIRSAGGDIIPSPTKIIFIMQLYRVLQEALMTPTQKNLSAKPKSNKRNC